MWSWFAVEDPEVITPTVPPLTSVIRARRQTPGKAGPARWRSSKQRPHDRRGTPAGTARRRRRLAHTGGYRSAEPRNQGRMLFATRRGFGGKRSPTPRRASLLRRPPIGSRRAALVFTSRAPMRPMCPINARGQMARGHSPASRQSYSTQKKPWPFMHFSKACA